MNDGPLAGASAPAHLASSGASAPAQPLSLGDLAARLDVLKASVDGQAKVATDRAESDLMGRLGAVHATLTAAEASIRAHVSVEIAAVKALISGPRAAAVGFALGLVLGAAVAVVAAHLGHA